VQVTEGDGYYLGRVLVNAQIAAPKALRLLHAMSALRARVGDTRKNARSPEHPDTAESLINRDSLLHDKGEIAGAPPCSAALNSAT
jgi:hypothetical protein